MLVILSEAPTGSLKMILMMLTLLLQQKWYSPNRSLVVSVCMSGYCTCHNYSYLKYLLLALRVIIVPTVSPREAGDVCPSPVWNRRTVV